MIKYLITVLMMAFSTLIQAQENYRWVFKPQFEDARNVFGHSVQVKQNGYGLEGYGQNI